MTAPNHPSPPLTWIATLFGLAAVLAATTLAATPPDLTKDKFSKVAEFLELTEEQEDAVRPKVARLQEIFRMAKRQQDEMGRGRRGGVGGLGGFGMPGGGPRSAPRPRDGQEGDRPDPEEMIEERRGWERELESLVSRIQAELTEPQIERFSEIETPELPRPPERRRP